MSKTEGMAVRVADADDARSLAGVHSRSWAHTYRGLLDESLLSPRSLESNTMRFESLLSDRSSNTMVHEIGGKVSGFVIVRGAQDVDKDPKECGEIQALYVEPEFQGHGVGRSLFDKAVDALGARGCNEAVLWVLENNQNAREFYERMGMQLDLSKYGEREQMLKESKLKEVRYRMPLRCSKSSD